MAGVARSANRRAPRAPAICMCSSFRAGAGSAEACECCTAVPVVTKAAPDGQGADVAAPFQGAPVECVPPPPAGCFDLVVVGSGVSTAVPMLSHVLRRECPSAETAVRRRDRLTVCEEAHRNPASKNRRHNVSVLLRYTPPDGGPLGHIMVDAGKTMRQAVLEAFPKVGADTIQALLVTHGHADAILGIDDLRDLQRLEHVYDDAGAFLGYRPFQGSGPLKVVSNFETLQRVRETFPYLCREPELSAPGVMMRRTLWLEMEQLEDDNASLTLAGLPVRCFPVWHGGTYVSLGFAFGTKAGGRGHPLVYISDVKEVPPDTMVWLEEVAEAGIDVLMVDALSRKGHSTHFSFGEAINFVRRLRPKRALFVGIASCEIGDHDEVNEELSALRESEGLDVQLAFDGMVLPPLPASE